MVRFPCGSMSQQRTRLPFSAKATARLRVVVVFATPPFWFAKAMTFAMGGESSVPLGETGTRALFATPTTIPPSRAGRMPCVADGTAHDRAALLLLGERHAGRADLRAYRR